MSYKSVSKKWDENVTSMTYLETLVHDNNGFIEFLLSKQSVVSMRA